MFYSRNYLDKREELRQAREERFVHTTVLAAFHFLCLLKEMSGFVNTLLTGHAKNASQIHVKGYNFIMAKCVDRQLFIYNAVELALGLGHEIAA